MDETGKLLASALVEYPLYSPKPNWAEQEPADWKRAAIEALSALASKINTRDVKALGSRARCTDRCFSTGTTP